MDRTFHVGDVYGRWTIINSNPIRKNKENYLFCKCECGTEKYVMERLLRNGKSKSCGCLAREKFIARNTKHGDAHSPLHYVWCSIRRRCNNPKEKEYPIYGGRGIKVCPEWDDYNAFRSWAYSHGYDESLGGKNCSIDRIDVNGDYEPSNCRWISMYDQQDNRQNTIYITYNGETHTIREWSRITGIPHDKIHDRYTKGHSLEDVFFNGNLYERRNRDELGRFIRR